MSAAFNTVNHEILFSSLEHRYGMAGSVLAWMRSYLTDWSQCVYLQGGASSKTGVACGVPQGLVLGPLLFSAYTAPIGDIIRRHNLSFHLYADDTQLYITFEMTEITRLLSLRQIEQCLTKQHWLNAISPGEYTYQNSDTNYLIRSNSVFSHLSSRDRLYRRNQMS